jgi:hypothetical protein
MSKRVRTRKEAIRPTVEMPDPMKGVIEGNRRKAEEVLAEIEAAGWVVCDKSMESGPRFSVLHAAIQQVDDLRYIRWNPKDRLFDQESQSKPGQWFPFRIVVR